MHSIGKIINELHAMLKLHEQTLPNNNTLALHAIRAEPSQTWTLLSCSIVVLDTSARNTLRSYNMIDFSINELRFLKNASPWMSGKMARNPYTHQVERAKDLLGLIHTDNPTRYGSLHDESNALKTAARILNMVPNKKVEKTPYEVWHGQAPKLPDLKVWGCEALVKRDTLTKPDK
ncbi:hypothetical protein Tco_1535464, partial [Tanacetum coccineum]